ncbi:MAG: hypothetical protein ACN6PN_20500 [Sphingobacterium sp.]
MKTYFIIAAAIFTACSSPSRQPAVQETPAEVIENSQPTTDPVLDYSPRNYSYNEIAKYAIATSMFQHPENLTVKNEVGIYIVSYFKDSKQYPYKIKFNQDQIIWGVEDGRWREHPTDEKLAFKEVGNELQIIQHFTDGSNSIKEFQK